MLIVRGRYMSGAGTCPGQVHVRGRYMYMSEAGTCPGQVHVRGRYMSGAGTCPGQVHVRGRYMSGAGTCPGQVHVWGRYMSGAGTCTCACRNFCVSVRCLFHSSRELLQCPIFCSTACYISITLLLALCDMYMYLGLAVSTTLGFYSVDSRQLHHLVYLLYGNKSLNVDMANSHWEENDILSFSIGALAAPHIPIIVS